jgi:hypothetical protein
LCKTATYEDNLNLWDGYRSEDLCPAKAAIKDYGELLENSSAFGW